MASRSKGVSVQLLLAILLGLIALAFVAGLLLSRGGGPTVVTGEQSRDAAPMFPELADTRERIARVVITTAGKGDGDDGSRVELARGNGRWHVAAMADYPTVPGRVATFLDTLTNARRIERADPEAARTAMQEDRRWRRVRLETEAGEPVLTAAIGAQVSTPAASDLTATYVRPSGGDAVWLADLELTHPIAQPKDWLDRELLALRREQIAEVHTAPTQGTALHIRRIEGATGEFEAVDVDRELMADKAWKVGDLTVPFTSLRFLDARPAEGEPESWPGYVATTTGLELRFTIMKDGDGHWARFKLASEPDRDTDDNDVEQTEPPVDVAALRRAIDGRAFKLPAYTATRMVRGREALQREDETKDAAGAEASGATAGDQPAAASTNDGSAGSDEQEP